MDEQSHLQQTLELHRRRLQELEKKADVYKRQVHPSPVGAVERVHPSPVGAVESAHPSPY